MACSRTLGGGSDVWPSVPGVGRASLMAIVQIGPFPARWESAQDIIRLMIEWRDLRRTGRIGRNQFLTGWSALRERLARTQTYRRFVNRVRSRARGRCQGSGCSARGTACHHVVPVAMDPSRALTLTNALWLCKSCHADIHPHLRHPNGSQEEA